MTATYQEYGTLIDVDDESHVPSLSHLTRDAMERLLDDALGRLNATQRALDMALAAVAECGDLSLQSTWDAAEKAAPALIERVRQAEANAHKAANFAKVNGGAIRREADRTPLVLRPDEEASAAERLPLLKAVVETAGLSAVRDHLAHAIREDDRPALYALAMLIPSRLDRPTDSPAEASPRLRNEIKAMLANARSGLRDRSTADLGQKAGQVLTLAGKLSSKVRTRTLARSLSESAYARQYGQFVPWQAAEDA